MREDQTTSRILIEPCTSLASFQECEELQRRIWGDPDKDLIPTSLFTVASKTGGHVLLARIGSEAVGFALAFASCRDGLCYLHSHIVGVLPHYQNRGLGRHIKEKQRELALQQGLSLIEWTFDPLALRNAYFNIVRLGAVITKFHPNLYGVTASPLHGGLPTDRLVAAWWLSSRRVLSALAAEPQHTTTDAVVIEVPAQIELWKTAAPERAAKVQATVRTSFQEHFAAGLVVTGFRMEAEKGVYLLERTDAQSGSVFPLQES